MNSYQHTCPHCKGHPVPESDMTGWDALRVLGLVFSLIGAPFGWLITLILTESNWSGWWFMLWPVAIVLVIDMQRRTEEAKRNE